MKHTHTTASTTYTTKGWKKDHLGQFIKIIDKDTKPAFQKEIDQTLFSKKVNVEDLPKATWYYGGCDCPNDLIKYNISHIIDRLVETIEENQKLESQNKKATVNINWLEEAKDDLEKVLVIAILYNRYNTTYGDFFSGSDRDSKLVSKLKAELVDSLKRYGLDI